MSLASDALNLEQLFAEIDALAARSWHDTSGDEFRRRYVAPLIDLAQEYRREAEHFERALEAALREMP